MFTPVNIAMKSWSVKVFSFDFYCYKFPNPHHFHSAFYPVCLEILVQNEDPLNAE